MIPITGPEDRHEYLTLRIKRHPRQDWRMGCTVVVTENGDDRYSDTHSLRTEQFLHFRPIRLRNPICRSQDEFYVGYARKDGRLGKHPVGTRHDRPAPALECKRTKCVTGCKYRSHRRVLRKQLPLATDYTVRPTEDMGYRDRLLVPLQKTRTDMGVILVGYPNEVLTGWTVWDGLCPGLIGDGIGGELAR